MKVVPPDPIEGVDLLWILQGGCTIFMMAAGFALMETGSVRSKNSQSIFIKISSALLLSAFTWWAIGYALAFGDLNAMRLVGMSYFFCSGFENKDYGDWFLRWVSAAMAIVAVSGSLSERINMNAYFAFVVLITGIIYPVIAAAIFNDDGFLHEQGFHDLGGSGVVHLTAGVAGFIGAIMLGPRKGGYEA